MDYTPSPEEAEFSGLTAGVGTIQLRPLSAPVFFLQQSALNVSAVCGPLIARHGVPIDRLVLADWMGRTGALIAPVVDRMAVLLKQGSTRLYVDETTAPVLDPGRGKTKTGYLWAVLRDDHGWNGPAPPGMVFHYRPDRKGEYANELLTGFNGTIQVDAYGGYTHLAKPNRKRGEPLKLAFCWAHRIASPDLFPTIVSLYH